MHVQICKGGGSYPYIYMEALAFRTSAPTVHCEDRTRCIYVIEAKTVTPIVLKIDIPVCFLQEHFDNGLFITKYEKSSVILADMCTKPCAGPIFSLSTQWMSVFIFYPTSETKHYQLIILH